MEEQDKKELPNLSPKTLDEILGTFIPPKPKIFDDTEEKPEQYIGIVDKNYTPK